jgi:putative oxidoreductase
MIFSSLSRLHDLGLLLLRLGIGGMFILYGLPKMLGGPDLWTKLGGAMGNFGITLVPAFWGFMSMLAELGGGICMVLGVAFRPAMILMFINMTVAVSTHLPAVTGWGDLAPKAGHPIEMGVIFLSLLFVGPGRWSIDACCWSKQPPAP